MTYFNSVVKSFNCIMSQEVYENKFVQVLADNCSILKTPICAGNWQSRATENGVAKVSVNKLSFSGVGDETLTDPTISYIFCHSFDGLVTVGNADSIIDKALERCICSMLVGEESKFILKFPSINNNNNSQEFSSYQILIECCIKLETLTNDTPVCEWSEEKLYQVAFHHKTEGVKLFHSGRKVESFLRFSKSFKFLNLINIKSRSENLKEVVCLRVALLNNMANCQLYFQNYVFASELCDKALDIDSNNIKSLYRRAIAFMNIQKYDEAKNDLNKIMQIEPSNTVAKEKYQELKDAMKEKDANYAAVIRKMFSS